MNTVTETIARHIGEAFPLARKGKLGADDPLLESGIVDSLGVLGLVSYLESEFGVTIADDDLVPENFQTIARLSAFVQSRRESVANR